MSFSCRVYLKIRDREKNDLMIKELKVTAISMRHKTHSRDNASRKERGGAAREKVNRTSSKQIVRVLIKRDARGLFLTLI